MELLVNQRCDRCNKDKKGCSRNVDGCQRCKTKGFKCTYLRKNKKNKQLSIEHFNKAIQKFKVNSNKNSIDDKDLKLLKSLDYGQLKIPAHAIKTLVNSFKLRTTYNAMATLFGGNIFNKPIDISVWRIMYTKFLVILERESKGNKMQSSIEYYGIDWFENYEDIKKEAINCYFKYLNSICPLFLKSTFDPNNRSSVLMMAIYATGLTFITKSSKQTILINYCHHILINVLKSIDYNPTLESLQIVVIAYQGLKSVRSLCEIVEARFESLAHIAYQLGLHYSTKINKNNQLSLERKLCFCALIYISGIRWIAYGFPSPFLSYLYDEKMELLSYATKLTNNASDLCSMLIAESNYHLSLIFIAFNENINSHEHTYESSGKMALYFIKRLKAKVAELYLKFIKLKKNGIIKSKLNTLTMDNIRCNFHNYCLLINRYLLLSVQSSDNPSLKKKHMEGYQKNIEKICYNIMEHITSMDYEFRIYINYRMLCFALTFLTLYIENPTENTNMMIQKALLVMEESEKSPLINSFSSPIKVMVSIMMESNKEIK